MKYGASPFDLLEDVAGFGGPDERLGMFIMTVDVLVDSCDEFLNATESSAAQPIFRQVAEEAFHHVQPGAACGSEVHAEAGMASKPTLDLGMLMGGVIVDDHVDLFAGRNHVVDPAQEFQPLLVTMP